MRDPYEILGLSRTASEQEVKSAFRSMAKQYHPDSNPRDPQAREKFTAVTHAYEILGDHDLREKFDRGEIGADGKRVFAHAGAGAAPPPPKPQPNFTEFDFGQAKKSADEIFAELMQKAGRTAKPQAEGAKPNFTAQPPADLNIAITLDIPLREAATGILKRITLPNGKTLDVDIPKGVEHGQVMTIKGFGWQSPSGKGSGDVIVTFHHAHDAPFRLEGMKAYVDLPVTLDEAILGGTVRIPTFYGAVDMNLPRSSTGREILRLKSKGWPQKDGTIGDLFITMRVVLPENDDELQHFAQTIRAQRPYTTRGVDFR